MSTKGIGVLILVCTLEGCVTMNAVEVARRPSEVEVLIEEHARTVAGAMDRMARALPAQPELTRAPKSADNKPQAVEWYGSVEPLLRSLATSNGYEFAVLGARPLSPLMVTVVATPAPFYEILRSVGLQLGSRATVALDSERKRIELVYGS